MNDKHDPNAGVPIGTFAADESEFEIPIEVVSDDDIEPATLAIQSNQDDPGRFNDEHTPVEAPRRKRTQTLLGVAMPGSSLSALPTLPAAHDPTKASRREISRAVDDALDEQPTSVYAGHAQVGAARRDSGGLTALDSMLEARGGGRPAERQERHERDIPSNPPGEIVGVVGRATDTGTFQIELFDVEVDEGRKTVPVLAPPVFVEASARETRDNHARETREHNPPPRQRTEPQLMAAQVPAAAREPAPEPKVEVQPAPVPAARVETKPAAKAETKPASAPGSESAPKSTPISSLAPTEIPRRPGPSSAGRRKEPSSSIGAVLVAAMVLLGIGGWWLTAGGYRRGDDGRQTSAAASYDRAPQDSLASLKIQAPAPVAPAPQPTEVAALEASAAQRTAADSAAPAPDSRESRDSIDTRSTKPRVATKTVRKPAPAPVAAGGPIETPSRSDVLTGLDGVRSSVQACAEGRNGVAEVDLTIAANGIVTNALVGGDFGGTPQGSCIARAVRKARFPTFKQDRYRVLFPYVL